MHHQPVEFPVTRPSVPPLGEFTKLLRQVWSDRWLTNNGQFHRLFERELAGRLGVKYVSLFCNGTVALQLALQALDITGEVITTPFSFPATVHAIANAGCTPVFCDIRPGTCNIDPSRIESLVTPRTRCILPVHVYGMPCDAGAIRKIALSHGLKVIYDAAHAFGVELNGRSVLNRGDISMLSFHATKPFNTAEGGALVTGDPFLKDHLDRLKNFGIEGEASVAARGTNGKMSELHAAYGLVQLKYVEKEIAKRLELAETYRSVLCDVPGLKMLDPPPGLKPNGAYFPIFVDEREYGMSRDELCSKLRERGIGSRRYFYPLLSNLPMYRGLPSARPEKLPFANEASERVICLPLYSELGVKQARRIALLVSRAFRSLPAVDMRHNPEAVRMKRGGVEGNTCRFRCQK